MLLILYRRDRGRGDRGRELDEFDYDGFDSASTHAHTAGVEGALNCSGFQTKRRKVARACKAQRLGTSRARRALLGCWQVEHGGGEGEMGRSMCPERIGLRPKEEDGLGQEGKTGSAQEERSWACGPKRWRGKFQIDFGFKFRQRFEFEIEI